MIFIQSSAYISQRKRDSQKWIYTERFFSLFSFLFDWYVNLRFLPARLYVPQNVKKSCDKKLSWWILLFCYLNIFVNSWQIAIAFWKQFLFLILFKTFRSAEKLLSQNLIANGHPSQLCMSHPSISILFTIDAHQVLGLDSWTRSIFLK